MNWKFCPQCGHSLTSEWKFCAECGQQVGAFVVPMSQPVIVWPYSPTIYPNPVTWPSYPTITWANGNVCQSNTYSVSAAQHQRMIDDGLVTFTQ